MLMNVFNRKNFKNKIDLLRNFFAKGIKIKKKINDTKP